LPVDDDGRVALAPAEGSKRCQPLRAGACVELGALEVEPGRSLEPLLLAPNDWLLPACLFAGRLVSLPRPRASLLLELLTGLVFPAMVFRVFSVPPTGEKRPSFCIAC
jgi:hypothetical protein